MFFGNALNQFGMSMSLPFISIYLYSYLGVSAELTGFAIFFSSLAGAIFQLVGGEVCDRLGRKPVFVLGLLLLIVSFLSLGWAVSVNAPYVYHLAFLTLTRVATGLFRPMPNVIAADIVPAERRLEAFSLLRIGLNTGFALGPLVGGVMALFSYSSMFYFTAITAAVYMLLVIAFIGDTRTCKPAGRLGLKDLTAIAQDRPFMAFAALTFLIGVFYSQMYTPLSIYAKGFAGLTEPEIGIMFAINGAMVVLIQYPVTLLTERYRLTAAMGIGALLYAIGFTLVSASSGMLMIGLCVFVVTMGELCFMPSSTTLTANLSTGDRRGRYIGFQGLMNALGFAIGPLLGGYLIGVFGAKAAWTWPIIGAGCVMCAIGFFYLKRLVPENKDSSGYMKTDGR